MATRLQLNESEERMIGRSPSLWDDSLLRKKLIRRALPDHSQLLRRSFQFAFLLLNVWLGGAFYFWVRGFESGSHLRTCNATRRRRRLASHRRPDELEVLAYHRPGSGSSSGRNVSLRCLSRDCIPVPQSILQLAVPGRNTVGISLARRATAVSPQLSIAALARSAAAQPEISFARILRSGP